MHWAPWLHVLVLMMVVWDPNFEGIRGLFVASGLFFAFSWEWMPARYLCHRCM
jgi:hypothetical protein